MWLWAIFHLVNCFLHNVSKKKKFVFFMFSLLFFFNYHLGVDYVFGCNFEFVLKLVMCFICVEVTKTGIPEASE